MNKSKKLFSLSLLISLLFTLNVYAETIEVSLVKDIKPGVSNSGVHNLIALNGKLLFSADEGIHDKELWVSDGTEGNTALLKDIRQGNSADMNFLTILNGVLFFVARDELHGSELWTSDGTTPGTLLVKDIVSGKDGSGPYEITTSNDTLYFGAREDRSLYGLWKSDGTKEGTVRIHSFTQPPVNLRTVNDVLYFTVSDLIAGPGIWKSDGTNAGTVLVKGTVPNTDLNSLDNFTATNDFLFFTANDGIHGIELWRTDGTESGTVLVKDINLGSSTSIPRNLIAFQGELYFRALGDSGKLRLWKSNGTAEGTRQVSASSSNPSNFKVVHDTLFFYAIDDSHGEELWKTDGTEEGTVLVKDINPGSRSSTPHNLFSLNERLDSASINDILYFAATDRTNGFEVWRTDGTPEGTFILKDIKTGSIGSSPRSFTKVNDQVYLVADDGTHGLELWAIKPDNYSPKASYILETTLLELPVVRVVDNTFNASLRLTSNHNNSFNFKLEDTGVTTTTSEHAALFTFQDGMVTIPTINLFQKGKLIGHTDAKLQLIDGSTPFQFELIHVGEIQN